MNPINDTFQYHISTRVSNNPRITKRTVLASIARIFNPLGFLGPIIVTAKVILQSLWALRLDWDESLPMELHTKWNKYRSQLEQLNELRIPRVLKMQTSIRNELHGFCDASQVAYGACVYLRSTNQNGRHHASLLCSKSRVTSIKTISLPRLELCGAQLLAQLINKLVPILNLKLHAIWTDSTIVIDWIKCPSRKFSTFVANRIGDIQERTNGEGWRHVRSNENPADALSRGVDPEIFKQIDLMVEWAAMADRC